MSKINLSLNVGSKIKSARKSAGLSQKQLAQSIQVSDKSVSAYEVGRANPPISTLREISKVTYKPVQFFLDETPEETDPEKRLKQLERDLLELKKVIQKQKAGK